eukprot:622347-Rhodomonas_salina.5
MTRYVSTRHRVLHAETRSVADLNSRLCPFAFQIGDVGPARGAYTFAFHCRIPCSVIPLLSSHPPNQKKHPFHHGKDRSHHASSSTQTTFFASGRAHQQKLEKCSYRDITRQGTQLRSNFAAKRRCALFS